MKKQLLMTGVALLLGCAFLGQANAATTEEKASSTSQNSLYYGYHHQGCGGCQHGHHHRHHSHHGHHHRHHSHHDHHHYAHRAHGGAILVSEINVNAVSKEHPNSVTAAK